jgi:hypothetical protein
MGEKRNRVYVWTAVGVTEEILLLLSLQKKGFRNYISVQFGVTERGEILHRWALWA